MESLFGRAFSPAGISSFFEICDCEEDGSPIQNPEKIGSKGGGFVLSKGITTEVNAQESQKTVVEVFINRKKTHQAKTTETMVNMLLERVKRSCRVKVHHSIDVPIGAGYGTSAAGALSCGLALSRALRLDLTYNEIGRMAHVADVICHTGLGTVEALLVGGLVLVVKSGAVGIGLVDRIPVPPRVKIVTGSFQPMDKRTVILSPDKRLLVNKLGRKTMRKILSNPNLKTFLRSCREFASNLGLMSENVKKLIRDAERAGAIGATQNMIGDAVHAITEPNKLKEVCGAFKEYMPEEEIIISNIDFQGARVLL